MHKQLTIFIDQHLSPYLCGYRKGYSTQHALVSLIEKWKACLDNQGFAGAILMDLSKAFDTINHELLIAKLHAYGLDKDSLAIVLTYMSDRWQRTRTNTTTSSWSELLKGVPQGSVLGPLLFNIYINELFFTLSKIDVCNYADDTTLYACDHSLENVMFRLEHDSIEAIIWFQNNYMKLNTDKCHLLISGSKAEHILGNVGDKKIWEDDKVKLFGVTIDNKLKFDYHVSDICLKAGRKLSALTRLTKFLPLERKRILLKAFIESQFKYCPLTWMFYSRSSNNKINRLHERTLRIIYDDCTSTFEELLDKAGSFRVHHSNIQTLAVELYKVRHNISTNIFSDIFIINNQNGPRLRSQNDFFRPPVRTVYNGENTLRVFGPIIWSIIPDEIKNTDSLDNFKNKIRKWKPINCPCRLCKDYVSNVGFVNIIH